MKVEEVKAAVETCTEIGKNRKKAADAIKGTKQQTYGAKTLWREGNKSRLAEIGMALRVVPEPTGGLFRHEWSRCRTVGEGCPCP